MTKFIKMLHILMLVPKWPRQITTAQLQEQLAQRGHRMNIRSIQRTLMSLSGPLPIESNELGKPYGWRWAKDASPERYLGFLEGEEGGLGARRMGMIR